jgi:Tfp pilus assembly protein PilN
MLAQKSRAQINLLPQEEFSDSPIGRVLHWALGTFRILVIVTEMIVMGSFLSRFWLDARSNDLNDSLKDRQNLIESKKGFENKFLATQKQLNIFSQITSQDNLISPYIEKVTSYLPDEIILNSISFTQNSLSLKGTSAGEASIAQLLANLKSPDASLGKVNLTGLGSNNQDETLLTFTIEIEVVQKGGK